MMIALEGAPGVGKSTMARALRAGGADVIPEVNRLFTKPDPEPPAWYYERQVARWEMAQLCSSRGSLAVLDGDLYQPLWFAWIYRDDGWPQNPAAFSFFRSAIAEGRMGFPGVYVFSHIPEPVRRERMMGRELSHGLTSEMAARKADRYARMVEPQRRFFAALAERFPGWVLNVETTSVERSVAAIRSATPPTPPSNRSRRSTSSNDGSRATWRGCPTTASQPSRRFGSSDCRATGWPRAQATVRRH